MLIRFIVKNIFSFKEQTEFNLLPGRATRLNHHKYERNGVSILKQSAIYGANGSGKSNLIKSIALLRFAVISGTVLNRLINQKFKLSKKTQEEPIEFGIEFYCNHNIYFYSVVINNGEIIDEFFAETGLRKDKLIFHRTFNDKIISIDFFQEFEEKPDNVVLKKLIEKDLLKPHQLLLSYLIRINNDSFSEIKSAYDWFEKSLTILIPESNSGNMPYLVDSDNKFRDFTNEMMSSFNTGINKVEIETKPIEDFKHNGVQFEIEQIIKTLMDDPEKKLPWENRLTGEKFVFVNQNGRIFSKRLFFHHKGEKSEDIYFDYNEESDGTRRLLELTPFFFTIINSDATVIIDEIESSIHPLIIKELVSKFSHDDRTQGQLIFSTHESNLLDQEIFRPDEIWFAEKGIDGATKLYSLSDFKEHSTIDIRKGYLTGRYGGVPFLGNLHDLNWDKE